ncbi:hypothetical protein [Streptomyces sp. 8N616]|uniref:hypothetical protein n=1 Tax=Streptomyces sp. 8N616 TaxID=3457414 RepID=UPI003FD401C6
MNTESHSLDAVLPWVPDSGHQLHKAGVHFDAVRLAGSFGRALADELARLTAGTPGPVIQQANGPRYVYFLVPPGSTGHRRWPHGSHRATADSLRGDCYVSIPALEGHTWPLSWRYPPTADGHLVHPLLLHLTLCAMAGEPARGMSTEGRG